MILPMSRRVLITQLAMCVLQRAATLKSLVRLLAQGRISLADIITHEIPFEKAAEAYEMITKNPNHERYIGVLLKYDENDTKWQSRIENPKAKREASGEKIRLGLIGAGNFVRSTCCQS